jgi:hypothetical protein
MAQMSFIDVNSTTVAEVHEMIMDLAMEIANAAIANDDRIARKYRGPALMNATGYNDGKLVLEITDEYQTAPDKVKSIYREHALQAVQRAIVHSKEAFAGLILGEAKVGRNYFNTWSQAPTRLF